MVLSFVAAALSMKAINFLPCEKVPTIRYFVVVHVMCIGSMCVCEKIVQICQNGIPAVA